MSDAMAVTDRSPVGSRYTYTTEAQGVTREHEEAHAVRMSAASEQEGELAS